MDGDAPGAGRTLGIDLGDRRIGLALSDPLGISARALLTLERGGLRRDLAGIRDVVSAHEVRRIVVGLPLGMDGGRGQRVPKTEAFMTRLRAATGLPVIAWDERLTTVQAERTLIEADLSRSRRREVIDQVAAVILLQSWLDAQREAAGA
jgi:putative Holliday junction resolvase